MEQRIDTSQFGVVIVDMQLGYLNRLTPQSKEFLIQNHLDFLKQSRKFDIPLIVFECQDSRSVNYHGTIPILREEIKKSRRYAFFEKEHEDGITYYLGPQNKITEWNLETLCITGVNAAACVMETAEGALNQDCKILTAINLIGDRLGEGGITHAEKWFKEKGQFYPSYQDLLKNLK